MSTSAPLASGRAALLRWLVAILAFPIGGYVGHLVAGPAATAPTALLSGAIAGGVIGLGQGLALGLGAQSLAAWAGATASALGVALTVVTAAIGQIGTTVEAIALGLVAGLAIGAVQAVLLQRERLASVWAWVLGSGVAWAIGWLITAGAVNVSLAAGWPVYGLSGAIVSQVITGVILWRVLGRGAAAVVAAA